jgi:hypothetical protein
MSATTHTHTHDGPAFNAAEHGHSHDVLHGPGSYMDREMPLIEGRDWADRAFTVGIGGYGFSLLCGGGGGGRRGPGWGCSGGARDRERGEV